MLKQCCIPNLICVQLLKFILNLCLFDLKDSRFHETLRTHKSSQDFKIRYFILDIKTTNQMRFCCNRCKSVVLHLWLKMCRHFNG